MDREEGDYDWIHKAEEGNPGPQRSIEVNKKGSISLKKAIGDLSNPKR